MKLLCNRRHVLLYAREDDDDSDFRISTHTTSLGSHTSSIGSEDGQRQLPNEEMPLPVSLPGVINDKWFAHKIVLHWFTKATECSAKW